MIKRANEMIRELRENARGGTGTVEFVHIFGREELKGGARLVAKLILNPGCSIGKHPHENEEEIFYIMKGKGLIDDNGEIRELCAGDVSITGGGGYHSITNNSNEILEIFAVVLLS